MTSRRPSPGDLVAPVARRVVSLHSLEHAVCSASSSHTHIQDQQSETSSHDGSTGTIVIGIEKAHLDTVQKHCQSADESVHQKRTRSAPPMGSYSPLDKTMAERALRVRRTSFPGCLSREAIISEALVDSPSSTTFQSVEEALHAGPQSITDITHDSPCNNPRAADQSVQLLPPIDEVLVILDKIIDQVTFGVIDRKLLLCTNTNFGPQNRASSNEHIVEPAKIRTPDSSIEKVGEIEIIFDAPVSTRIISVDLTEKSRASWKQSDIVTATSTDWQDSCRSRATTMMRPSSSAFRHQLNDVRASPRTRRLWAVFWLVILMGATIGLAWFLLYNSPWSSFTNNARASIMTTTGTLTTIANVTSTNSGNAASQLCLTNDWRCNFINFFNSSSESHAYDDAKSSAYRSMVSKSQSVCLLVTIIALVNTPLVR